MERREFFAQWLPSPMPCPQLRLAHGAGAHRDAEGCVNSPGKHHHERNCPAETQKSKVEQARTGPETQRGRELWQKGGQGQSPCSSPPVPAASSSGLAPGTQASLPGLPWGQTAMVWRSQRWPLLPDPCPRAQLPPQCHFRTKTIWKGIHAVCVEGYCNFSYSLINPL